MKKKLDFRWHTFNMIMDVSPKKLTEKLPAMTGGEHPTKPLTGTDKIIFCAIFRSAKLRTFGGERGYFSRVSIRQITEMTGTSKETVILSIKKWVKIGMVKISRRGVFAGAPTIYKVNHFARETGQDETYFYFEKTS